MISRKLLLTAAVALTTTTASAYRPTDRDLVDKISSSQLVVIGRVTSIDDQSDHVQLVVTPSLLLKGTVGHMIEVWVDTSIPALRPNCCVVDAMYMFFLNRSSTDAALRPLPGAFGVMLIENAGTVRGSPTDRPSR